MLSDEEREAIERLNKRYDFLKENPLATNVWLTLDIHNLGIVLNLIEKQSKEIEELKEKYSKKLIEFQKEREWYEKNFISKDKIKAKIEVMNTNIVNAEKFDCDYIGQCRFAKYVLQSLLEKE